MANVTTLRDRLLSLIGSLLCIFGFMTHDGGFARTFPFLPPQGFGIPMIVVGALLMVWAGVLLYRRARAMGEAAQRELKANGDAERAKDHA